MRTSISKNQNTQLPSMEGRANEITPLLETFFNSTSPDGVETMLLDMLQEYIEPTGERTSIDIVNNLFGIREIVSLIRNLEVINNQLKGDLSC